MKWVPAPAWDVQDVPGDLGDREERATGLHDRDYCADQVPQRLPEVGRWQHVGKSGDMTDKEQGNREGRGMGDGEIDESRA